MHLSTHRPDPAWAGFVATIAFNFEQKAWKTHPVANSTDRQTCLCRLGCTSTCGPSSPEVGSVFHSIDGCMYVYIYYMYMYIWLFVFIFTPYVVSRVCPTVMHEATAGLHQIILYWFASKGVAETRVSHVWNCMNGQTYESRMRVWK